MAAPKSNRFRKCSMFPRCRIEHRTSITKQEKIDNLSDKIPVFCFLFLFWDTFWDTRGSIARIHAVFWL